MQYIYIAKINMEKIDYNQFEKIIKNMDKNNIYINIQTMVKTKITINNANITLGDYLLTFCSKKNEKVEIDINYIANFYASKNSKSIKLELDAIGYIIIEQI